MNKRKLALILIVVSILFLISSFLLVNLGDYKFDFMQTKGETVSGSNLGNINLIIEETSANSGDNSGGTGE